MNSFMQFNNTINMAHAIYNDKARKPDKVIIHNTLTHPTSVPSCSDTESHTYIDAINYEGYCQGIWD